MKTNLIEWSFLPIVVLICAMIDNNYDKLFMQKAILFNKKQTCQKQLTHAKKTSAIAVIK